MSGRTEKEITDDLLKAENHIREFKREYDGVILKAQGLLVDMRQEELNGFQLVHAIDAQRLLKIDLRRELKQVRKDALSSPRDNQEDSE